MRILSSLLHHVYLRPRLALGVGVGLAVWLLLPRNLSPYTCVLVAWDAGTLLYLLLAWVMMLRANVESMCTRAQRQDDGAVAVLSLTVGGALASLAAIALELVGAKGFSPQRQALHLALAALTILCSWCLVHTAFALHYAHEFYLGDEDAVDRCLQFPGDTQPGYLDFLYFSFVIGTTSQTADVSIASRSMRGLALLHGVIAFFFNTTLLALTINIAASLI